MDLKQVIPQNSSFTLQSTGKTYSLRKVTLEDEGWMQENFGDKTQEIFEKMDMQQLSRLVFRLLSDEDRTEFAKRKVKFIDEEGNYIEREVGGVALFKGVLSGMNDKIEVVRALLETIGISRPMQDKLEKGEIKESDIDVKKKKKIK